MSDRPIRDYLKLKHFVSYSLEEKMTAAYENSEWKPVKWERDMHCAVKVPAKSQWRRGQIIRMVTDTLVEVSVIVKMHFHLFSVYLLQFLLCFTTRKKFLKCCLSLNLSLLFSQVLLYDVGVELVVSIHCLRELQDSLKTMGRLSLECSLVDIR